MATKRFSGWGTAVLMVAGVFLTCRVFAATAPGETFAADSSTSTSTSISSTTTTLCPETGTPPAPLIAVHPTTLWLGEPIEVSGSNLLGQGTVIVNGCPQRSGLTGPVTIYLVVGGITTAVGVVAAVDGSFTARLTVPTSVSGRGAGLVQYDPNLSFAHVAVVVVSPPGPPQPVPGNPEFTG